MFMLIGIKKERYEVVDEGIGKTKKHEKIRLIRSCVDGSNWNVAYLAARYAGHVKGGISKQWCFESTDFNICEEKAKKIFKRKAHKH